MPSRIVVIGVGNLLAGDDGLGPRLIETLAARGGTGQAEGLPVDSRATFASLRFARATRLRFNLSIEA